MSGRECKVFSGKHFRFIKAETEGLHGGNGGVYKVVLLKEGKQCQYPLVAKFFEYDGPKDEKEKRYRRFQREICTVQKLQSQNSGIVPVLDMYCPEHVPESKEEAWYLMPEAKRFSITWAHSLERKLEQMLELAEIIDRLHQKKMAHRDIKPENILILNGKITLSDFGLVWIPGQERLTGSHDKIGPFRILPPELRDIDLSEDLNYCPSDVYLFAKVLWIVLAEDNYGFSDMYNRKNKQVYLRREKYHVATLEPIHQLIEKATVYEMNRRIGMKECIRYLKLQISIVRQTIPLEAVNQYYITEIEKEMISQNEPDDYVYREPAFIYKYFQSIVGRAMINVKSIEKGNTDHIKAEFLNVHSDGTAALEHYENGKKTEEYLFCASKMIYQKVRNNGRRMIVELKPVESVKGNYQTYGAQKKFISEPETDGMEKDEIWTEQYVLTEEYLLIIENNGFDEL